MWTYLWWSVGSFFPSRQQPRVLTDDGIIMQLLMFLCGTTFLAMGTAAQDTHYFEMLDFYIFNAGADFDKNGDGWSVSGC